MLKEWLKRLKKEKSEDKNKDKLEYENRFMKFYYLNQNRLNKERRGSYGSRRKSGICVRCKRPAVKGIVFCEYHQEKQREYNQKARGKFN